MPRKKIKKKKQDFEPDLVYKSPLVTKFINHVLKEGKKTVAQKIVYGALEEAGKKVKKDPLVLLDKVIENIAPVVEIRTRRIGGGNYQIPCEVEGDRGVTLAYRWLIDFAKQHKGMKMEKALALELVDAFNNTGSAIKKKENVHKMAEANKAFSHLKGY